MIDWNGKRYWLIGASEGLGRALAHQLSRVGVEVIVSARSEDRLNDLVAELPGRARAVTCDVSSLESVSKAAEEVGDVDGVVYLAGVYWPMTPKEIDAEKLELMADVNLTGAMRVAGVMVPKFANQDRGHIVFTGSLSGFRGLPGAVGYGASKSGVMSLAETLYADLRKTNVRIQLANPGFIKTRLTNKNDFKMPFLMEPEDAAREIFDHMNSPSFARNFPTMFSWVFRLANLLPDWAYFRLIS
ncbi:SDR family oxidoreductase [Donghicola sp.]|uniref:SDR family NAD(P)-dependent oxidoreductase n=1 Tax=Donghicola sp. TaxID=1929294 RepID=UPI0025D224FD|nr:SDR family NAD(P)-dependent oxidoreductase [Donghicola sp.]MCT4578396.1 SDR family NAD(P)-dependent oxidoreductase [Donghicola sp.]